jgi:hypothetical protein
MAETTSPFAVLKLLPARSTIGADGVEYRVMNGLK